MSAEARAVTPSAEFECAICGAHLDRLHLDVDGADSRCSFCGSPQQMDTVDQRTHTPASGTRSADVGETLRNGRMVRGETLEQAARHTRIRVSYLRDLEQGATGTFDPYPGRVYARYFLREYADHLGLDPTPLVRGFDAETEPAVTPVASPPRPRRGPSQRRWALGAALLLCVLLFSGASLSRGGIEPLVTPAGPRSRTHAAGPHAQELGRSDGAEPGSPLRAVIATDRACWVLAIVDGEIALQETVPPGETVSLRATRTLRLRFGDAGGVRLTVNGRRIATGGSGDIAELSFVARDGRLVLS